MEHDEKKCPFCAEIIKAAAHVCKHCKRELITVSSPSHGSKPVTVDLAPTKKKIGCFRIFLYCFGAIIVIGMIQNLLTSPEEKAQRTAERQANAANKEAERAQREAKREAEKAAKAKADAERVEKERLTKEREESAVPQIQKDFIAAIAAGYSDFRAGSNEIQQEQARDKRARAVAKILGSPNIENWVGTISSIGTNSDGMAILEIKISESPEIIVSTWNNALSDIGSNTLIRKGTTLYNTLANFKKGDKVFFSGEFVTSDRDAILEGSMTIRGSMHAPDYKIRFSNVRSFE